MMRTGAVHPPPLREAPPARYRNSGRHGLLALVAIGILVGVGGCASPGHRADAPAPMPVCAPVQAGVFSTAARRFADRASALGFIDSLVSRSARDGDLIITDKSVDFVACDDKTPEHPVFSVPHGDAEMVYRDGKWLILRLSPVAGGQRLYYGFAVHGTTFASGASLAKAALAQINRHRAAAGLFVSPPKPAADLVLTYRNDLEMRIASVDRSKLGAETGKGVAAGAAGGLLAGLNPQAPIALYPPAAAILIVSGALIGGVAGSVQAEKEAQRNALMIPLDDAVLNRAVHELEMGATLARQIEPLLRVETRWHAATGPAENLNCGDYYRDCALRGIEGVVEVVPARIEFRADKADLLEDEDQARQTATLFQRVYLYSTLSGHPVASIEVTARLGRYSLAEWRKNDGARLKTEIRDAMGPMPDAIAMQLQSSLDKLQSFE